MAHVGQSESKSPTSFFPTAQQVASTDLAILRTAGLSGRKAEYGKMNRVDIHTPLLTPMTVRDLAARFADGRLSTEKLLQASDDELAEILIEVKGIGRVSPLYSFEHFNTNIDCSGLVRSLILPKST